MTKDTTTHSDVEVNKRGDGEGGMDGGLAA